MGLQLSPGYDPFSPEVKRDPYPSYVTLRREAPVLELAARGMWAVSRHADVGFALKRPDLFSSSVNADRADIPASETLLGADPPAHTGLRKRVEAAFSPRRIRTLAQRARELAHAFAADLAARGGGDVVAGLAAPLPVILIAELMAIDPARHDDFKRGADAVIARGTGRPLATQAERDALDAEVAAFKADLAAVIEERRARPGDDLVSALVRDEDGAPGLAPAQALNFAVLLLLGGGETTTNLVGNALRALFADPAAMARVRSDHALVPALVEETLRHDAPVQCLLRRTTGDVELAGARLPARAIVLLLLGSANRDERVFEDAERFRLEREGTKHLAFGVGPHYCLGATLARLEAAAALEALVERRSLGLANPDVALVDSFVLRGPRALEITLGG